MTGLSTDYAYTRPFIINIVYDSCTHALLMYFNFCAPGTNHTKGFNWYIEIYAIRVTALIDDLVHCLWITPFSCLCDYYCTKHL